MFLHTVEKKPAALLAARLTEVEKMNVRAATEDGLQHLANTIFYGEIFGDLEIMKEVYAIIMENFRVDSARPGFDRATWKF